MRWIDIRFPWRKGKYANIDIRNANECPKNSDEIAMLMLLKKIPVDSELLLQAWWHQLSERHKRDNEYNAHIRLLERKLQAQKSEIRRLLKRNAEKSLEP